jgi:hypothetical protein
MRRVRERFGGIISARWIADKAISIRVPAGHTILVLPSGIAFCPACHHLRLVGQMRGQHCQHCESNAGNAGNKRNEI